MYPESIKDDICEKIAEGQSLLSVCKTDGMPRQSTVFRWLEDDESFREKYARARESQADVLFDEIIQIADDATEDANRSRLRVDARKWAAGKLRPKKYGEKADVTLSGDMALTVKVLTFGSHAPE